VDGVLQIVKLKQKSFWSWAVFPTYEEGSCFLYRFQGSGIFSLVFAFGVIKLFRSALMIESSYTRCVCIEALFTCLSGWVDVEKVPLTVMPITFSQPQVIEEFQRGRRRIRKWWSIVVVIPLSTVMVSIYGAFCVSGPNAGLSALCVYVNPVELGRY